MDRSDIESDISLLKKPKEKRQGVDDEDIVEALLNIIEFGEKQDKVLEGCSLPDIDISQQNIGGKNNHPLIFINSDISSIDLEESNIGFPIKFRDCDVGRINFENADLQYDISFVDTEFLEDINFFETVFNRDLILDGCRVSGGAFMKEATFGDDLIVRDCVFNNNVDFSGCRYSGFSIALEDYTYFKNNIFRDIVDFNHSVFRAVLFEDNIFKADAVFRETSFLEDVKFKDTEFNGKAIFDETVFEKDVWFKGSTFFSVASYIGTEIKGGTRILQDDANFESISFKDNIDFENAEFRYVNFKDITVEGTANYKNTYYNGDAEFIGAKFLQKVDFEEAKFYEDVNFEDAIFKKEAFFSGVEFKGKTKHKQENAVFKNTKFHEDAIFNKSSFTTADFYNTYIEDKADFRQTKFKDNARIYIKKPQQNTYVDFTDSSIRKGVFIQPEQKWIHYDITDASIGDISFEPKKQPKHKKEDILDYFRFCNTELDEFDGYNFSFLKHMEYLDRNNYKIHGFNMDENQKQRINFKLKMSPENIERTYLKAKTSASNTGQTEAAQEFRIKRQQYKRKKRIRIIKDKNQKIKTRLDNLSRALENLFMDITCGYGIRIKRIMTLFVITPLIFAFLYTFGGQQFLTDAGQIYNIQQIFTPQGQEIIYKNIYFSYITYLTIGYGNIGPQGSLARILAGSEVYLSIIFGGLFIYCLIKRSEI